MVGSKKFTTKEVGGYSTPGTPMLPSHCQTHIHQNHFSFKHTSRKMIMSFLCHKISIWYLVAHRTAPQAPDVEQQTLDNTPLSLLTLFSGPGVWTRANDLTLSPQGLCVCPRCPFPFSTSLPKFQRQSNCHLLWTSPRVRLRLLQHAVMLCITAIVIVNSVFPLFALLKYTTHHLTL